MCAATHPTARLSANCSVCAAAAHLLPGSYYTGFCPVESLCFVGTANGPLNHTCAGSDVEGVWSTSPTMCGAVYPTKLLSSNCSVCAAAAHDLPGSLYTGFCPGESACYVGTVEGPLNHTCVASDVEGVWSTSTSMCGAVYPAKLLSTNCSVCAAAAHDLPGSLYTGFCPSENTCYVGTTSGPLNHTCAGSDEMGVWTVSPGACVAVNPTTQLRDCASCAAGNAAVPTGYIKWCPSQLQCFWGTNDSSPANRSCAMSADLGAYGADCSCVPALLLNNEGSCHSCGDVFCYYGQYCQSAAAGAPSPCADEDQCGTLCLCPDSGGAPSNCTLCKAGHTNPAVGCSQQCAPNCFDCLPHDRATCATMCRAGFTGFPACQQLCPPQCAACGGSWSPAHALGSAPALNASQCLACSDPGARPPACDVCLPFVCRGAGGACNTPCADATGTATLSAPAAVRSDYPNCDRCKDAVSRVIDYTQLLQKAMVAEEAAEQVALAMELDCVLLPPPLDVACAFLVSAAEAGTGVAWVVSWVGAQLLEGLAAIDFCLVSRQCQYPCSPSRPAALASRLGAARPAGRGRAAGGIASVWAAPR